MAMRSFALDAATLLALASAVALIMLLIEHVGAEPLPYPKGREQCAGDYV
jgi:hypothetical protein